VRPPVVLDLVVRPPREAACNRRPPEQTCQVSCAEFSHCTECFLLYLSHAW
jgi:hypothetical protein